jgi:hypothetical protein
MFFVFEWINGNANKTFMLLILYANEHRCNAIGQIK